MGLLQVGIGAAAGVLADQWREYFYCTALDSDTLAVKGAKRQAKRNYNTKGSDNLISNGSVIAVNEGQCMLIVDQGAVVEVCAQAGEFLYDQSSEPSIFYGSLGKNILESFKQFGKRVAFGGDTAKDQRIYFINTKEILGNKYGTASPVPFRVVDQNIGLDVDISVRCHGEYAYHIVDPILFYKNVCGNVASAFKRDQLDSQLRSELLTALQPAFAKISEMGVRYSALPGHADDLADALNEVLSEKWGGHYGIKISSFGVSSATASEEDEKMIKELQRNAVFRNPTMAAAHLTAAQAEALKSAAANTSTGPMMAFAGMNMAANTGGLNAQQLFAMGQQQGSAGTGGMQWNGGQDIVSRKPAQPQPQETQAPAAQDVQAGKEQKIRPAADANGWFCPECGTRNKGKFCMECGTKKPAGLPKYRCDKCGWEPEDPTKPPKFCPECGDPFNDSDIQ